MPSIWSIWWQVAEFCTRFLERGVRGVAAEGKTCSVPSDFEDHARIKRFGQAAAKRSESGAGLRSTVRGPLLGTEFQCVLGHRSRRGLRDRGSPSLEVNR